MPQNEQEQLIIHMTKTELIGLIQSSLSSNMNVLASDLEIRLRPRVHEPKDETSYLDVNMLRKELGLSEPSVLKLCNDPNFPAIKVCGGWRIKRKHFDEWWKQEANRKAVDEESVVPEPVEDSSGHNDEGQ